MNGRSKAPAGLIRACMLGIGFAASLSSCAWLVPSVQPGDVLFQDDFSLPSSGWDRYRDETYEADYSGGAYRMRVVTAQTMVWSLPGVDLQNVQVVVEARAVSGSANNLFGTICRYENGDNFVFFLVSSDGFTGIGRFIDGKRVLLTDDSLLPTDAIPNAESTLTLTATCSGTDLQLGINGQTAAAAQVDQPTSGDIGLLAGTYDSGDITIEFDNLSVTLP